MQMETPKYSAFSVDTTALIALPFIPTGNIVSSDVTTNNTMFLELVQGVEASRRASVLYL